jgi:hypothetical protein
MAVAHDAASLSHANTTGSVSQASFAWTHTPVGTPAGVLVFTFSTTSANETATAVTYGSATLSAVSSGAAADTSTETGRCTAWFVGTGTIPTGAQTVTVTRTNNTVVMYAIAVTVTATGTTETGTPVLAQENAAVAELSTDDGSLSGTNSLRYSGLYYGGVATANNAGANSTLLYEQDQSTLRCISAVRETTAGTGARSVGFSNSSDDRAQVALAIREMSRSRAPAQGTPTFAGQAPAAKVDYRISPAQGAATLTGQAPTATVAAPRNVLVSWARLVVPTAGAAVNTNYSPAQGTVAATGQAPRNTASRRLNG